MRGVIKFHLEDKKGIEGRCDEIGNKKKNNLESSSQ